MDKRYQIFVSSTYVDLQEQRAQVIKAILDMGHIPVGMEMFSAADEEQWETIKREIDRSDYYLIIAAHRYGSTIKKEDNIGYTEKEFDYAVAKSVPRIGFVIQEGSPWNPEHVDAGPARKRLDAFKLKIRAKPVNFWVDAGDLGMKVAIALPKLIATSPRPGWGRSGAESERTLAAMTQLTEENAALRNELEHLRALSKEGAPVLDCQFVNAEGIAAGKILPVGCPETLPPIEFANAQRTEINQLVSLLDSMYIPAQLPPSVARSLDIIARFSAIPSVEFSEKYVLSSSRIYKVESLIRYFGIKSPECKWTFENLSCPRAILRVKGYGEVSVPDGGEDFSRYEAFIDVEDAITKLEQRYLQKVYLSQHIEIRLQIINHSRKAAQSLILKTIIQEDIALGEFGMDIKTRKETQVGCSIEQSFPLISPGETLQVPAFIMKLPKTPQEVNFTVRITGLNLPQAQQFPMIINVLQKPDRMVSEGADKA